MTITRVSYVEHTDYFSEGFGHTHGNGVWAGMDGTKG